MKENGGKVYVGCVLDGQERAAHKKCVTLGVHAHIPHVRIVQTHTHTQLCVELLHLTVKLPPVVFSCIFHALAVPVKDLGCPREDSPLLQGHVLL